MSERERLTRELRALADRLEPRIGGAVEIGRTLERTRWADLLREAASALEVQERTVEAVKEDAIEGWHVEPPEDDPRRRQYWSGRFAIHPMDDDQVAAARDNGWVIRHVVVVRAEKWRALLSGVNPPEGEHGD